METHEVISTVLSERNFADTSPGACSNIAVDTVGVDSCLWGTPPPKLPIQHLLDNLIDNVIPCPDEFRPTAKALDKYDLIISLDTEYVQNRTALNVNGKEVLGNTIVSYQYAATYREKGGNLLYAEGVIRTKDGKRLAYKSILAIVCKTFKIGHRRAAKLAVLSLAHFGAAEWAAYSDREDYLSFLTPVRKCPITLRDMSVSVPFGSGHYAKMNVCWRDTRPLTPGSGSLDKAAETTNYKKLKLPKGWIEKMDWVSAEHPETFDKYAIGDVRVTLEYYLKTILEFQELTGIEEAPLTIGDAVVRAYLVWLKNNGISRDEVFGYGEGIVADEFGKVKRVREMSLTRIFTEVMAAQSFMGGMNTVFHVGIFKKPQHIILDIDFSGAYPAALAVLPRIDWNTHGQPITIQDICNLHKAGDGNRQAIPIAFAHVKFAFPIGSRHACLPVASPFGLLYPRTGTTTCTGPEIALALELGASVEILSGVRFAPLFDNDFNVQLAFADFLSVITQERARQKDKESLSYVLLKEMANSFYGKLAQGVEHRNIRDLRGKSERLPHSKLTCPHYAAICTGLVRDALAAVSCCADQFSEVTVLSATTDGCMLSLPYDKEIELNEHGEPIPPPLQLAHPALYEKLITLYPVRALRAGLQNMGLCPDEWLVSKHVGDEALILKTRGYLLRWKGKQTFLAKCGHKISNADDLEALYYDEKIEPLPVTSLVSMQDIAQGKQVDLVQVTTKRRANADYDFKRVLHPDGTTTLPETVADIIECRMASDAVRRSGRRATVDAVALYRSGVQQRGGSEAAMRRQVLYAIAHSMAGWRPKGIKDKDIALLLGVSPDALKNAKRRKFLSRSLPAGPLLEKVIKDIAKKLKLRVTPEMRAVLVSR
jgi:hypothetical protein